jgi:hypothetical protein
MSDIFQIYTPNAFDTPSQRCLNDPIRLYTIVFGISIIFWFPVKLWERGTFLHDAWIASTIAIYALHLFWLGVANIFWFPSEDKWEYIFFAVVVVIATLFNALLVRGIPFAIPFICAFYGSQVIFSFGVTDPTLMTIMLVLLGAVCFSTAPLAVYILTSKMKEFALTLLDIAFRTIMMVTGVKFIIVQEAERNGIICCSISRSVQFSQECPLAISNILIIACIAVFVTRVGIDVYIWKQTRKMKPSIEEGTQQLNPEEEEEDEEDEDNSSVE